jgi:adenylylsulfate kinase-like enzyme
MIVWLTGQPGSGKTTLGNALINEFSVDYLVDGDDLRRIMPNPGYHRQGRHTNIDRAQAIAAFLDDRGYRIGVTLVAPYRKQRETFKTHRKVREVYLHYDPSLLRGRENFWVADYEPPLEADLVLDTGRLEVWECVTAIQTIL